MLIFLDIDGVMVPAKSWKAPELLEDGFPAFSKRATQALQQLIAEDVTIMLTTSHKGNFSPEEWVELFRRRGIDVKVLKSLPGNTSNICRREEIVNWVNVNGVNEDFVIIDDDKSLNELPEFLKNNLIQTSSHIGLTEQHVEAIRMRTNKSLLPA